MASGTAAPPATQQKELQKTPLNATHRNLRARMVDFGGWEMPVEYSGLIAEHMAVRTAVGLFDVSHMGDIQLRGPGSLAAVQRISMNDASRLETGQAHYSAMLYPNGTFVDDIIVHKFSDNDWFIVINAGTREKDYGWIRQNIGGMPGVHVNNFSDYYTQLAIQGPRAAETLAKLTSTDLSQIRNYRFTWGTVAGCHNTLIARTGYTGEDGFEIYIPSDVPTSERVWGEVLEAGREFGILPCGLGARNTLRLEAAMALYGHEISDEINVYEAGLERYAKLDPAANPQKGDFIGRDALARIGADGGPRRKLVGLEMLERGIARDGYPVLSSDGKTLGAVASGSPAPFLKRNIALAHLPLEFTQPGTEVAVQVRNEAVKARVVPTPFYRRPKREPALSGEPAVVA